MRYRLHAIPGHVHRTAQALQETFLVTAAATILIIRTDLWLTNYPQIGGGGLHIAHLLWGGLFMVAAIATLVTFLGRPSRRTATVIGGVGFGFFIDELGKFITSDNDYFYKPAAALIYVIFIALFLVSRAMRRRRELSTRERVSNVVELIGEAARGHYDEHDRARALALLDDADAEHPLVVPLRHFIDELHALPPRPPRRAARWVAAVRGAFGRFIERPALPRELAWACVAWALLSLLTVSELVLDLAFAEAGHMRGFESDRIEDLTLVNVASLASSLVSAAFVAAGVHRLWRGDRLAAYRWFGRAMLAALFVTRVFAFVESQFAAVLGLGIDLALLVTISAAIKHELRVAPQSLRADSSVPASVSVGASSAAHSSSP
jgi:hypothetical protein